MSYDADFELYKALRPDDLARKLEDFVAVGEQDYGRRFSRSPPPEPAESSTEKWIWDPQSPRYKLCNQEIKDRLNSVAGAQFGIQARDEMERIRVAKDKGLLEHPENIDLEEAAISNVQYRWVQQGIYDERWNTGPSFSWKHERVEPQSPRNLTTDAMDGAVSKQRIKEKRGSNDHERDWDAATQLGREIQDRQRSRPGYQFVYQLDKEREWIKMGLSQVKEDCQLDLDSKAYENVKSRWIRDGLWDDEWSALPGFTWRHERPSKYPAPFEEQARFDAFLKGEFEEAEKPPRWYFMAPIYVEPPRPRVLLSGSPSVSFAPGISTQGSEAAPSTESLKESFQGERQAKVSPSGQTKGPRKSLAKSAAESKGEEVSEGPTMNLRTQTLPEKPLSRSPKQEIGQKSKAVNSHLPRTRKPPVKKGSLSKEKNASLAEGLATSRPRRRAALKAVQILTGNKPHASV